MTAAGIDATYIQGYAKSITDIINGILVPVLISVAFIVFLWGVYKYFIQGASNETERATGRTFVLYGIIGFVIIFSVWGIVNIFMGTLGLTASGTAPAAPTINVGGTSGNSVAPVVFPGIPVGGTSSGAYPTQPTNGVCPAGRILDSSRTYCITDTSDPTGGYNTGE